MKKLLMGLMVVASALSVRASYMYWQVNESDFASAYSGGDAIAATLYGNGTALAYGAIGERNTYTFDTRDWSNYSFYVEIVNSSGSVARSAAKTTYTDLADNGFILEDGEMTSVAQAKVWHGGTYGVPEPTTGLLLCVGVALLGLKRKRV